MWNLQQPKEKIPPGLVGSHITLSGVLVAGIRAVAFSQLPDGCSPSPPKGTKKRHVRTYWPLHQHHEWGDKPGLLGNNQNHQWISKGMWGVFCFFFLLNIYSFRCFWSYSSRVGSFTVVHGLSRCGARAPECLGLVAAWHVGILVPWLMHYKANS